MSRAKTEFCGDADYLQRYLQERLSEVEESQVIEHIGSCPTCQNTLERLAASEAVWNRLGEHLSFGTPESHETCEFNERDRWVARLKEYLSPTDDPQMMGRLGPYEVCGLIGSGSTGIVLKALEPRLNRYVAIKVLSPAYSSLGASRKRFEREARAVAAVANEHVVPIFAVDEHRGIPFIVMQYISGGSLHQRLQKEGPLETCEVARIGLQVATGLAAAHAQGIVHRDVKPANVLLEHTVDRAMVTDFGLARVTDEATMTRSGTIAGTPQYMSPEQARGEGVDQRTDLFSLGSLLYAACTGRAPFRAETVYGVINRVCEATPRPIRELNPKIEPWLSDFIERLMAKHPDDRLATAEEVSEILAGELAHLQNPSAVPRPRRDWRMRRATPPARYRTAIILALGACLLLATAWLTAPTWSSALAVLGKGRQAKPAPPAAPAEPQPVASPAPPAVPAASPTPGALPSAPAALRPPVAVPGRTNPPVAAPVPPVARVPSPTATAPGLPPQAPPAPAVVPRAATAPLAPPHAVIQQVSEESFSIDRITTQTVRVALHGFDLSVVGTDDPQVSLTRTVQTTVPPRDDEAAIPMRAATVITSIEDGVLQIHNHPGESHDPPESGHLSLRLPREFLLQLNATGGSAEVRDFTGRCEAHVIDGNVTLSQVNGDVDARTDRGQIVLDGCQGDVELLATNAR
ncbi:MAG: serine/threonine-protein kinase [Planctomycetota bacterium]